MDRVFETNSSERGFYSILSKYCTTGMKPHHYNGDNKIVLATWKSPYASKQQNEWLEKKLYQIYKMYYWWVLINSEGLFFVDRRYMKNSTDRKGEVHKVCL